MLTILFSYVHVLEACLEPDLDAVFLADDEPLSAQEIHPPFCYITNVSLLFSNVLNNTVQ